MFRQTRTDNVIASVVAVSGAILGALVALRLWWR